MIKLIPPVISQVLFTVVKTYADEKGFNIIEKGKEAQQQPGRQRDVDLLFIEIYNTQRLLDDYLAAIEKVAQGIKTYINKSELKTRVEENVNYIKQNRQACFLDVNEKLQKQIDFSKPHVAQSLINLLEERANLLASNYLKNLRSKEILEFVVIEDNNEKYEQIEITSPEYQYFVLQYMQEYLSTINPDNELEDLILTAQVKYLKGLNKDSLDPVLLITKLNEIKFCITADYKHKQREEINKKSNERVQLELKEKIAECEKQLKLAEQQQKEMLEQQEEEKRKLEQANQELVKTAQEKEQEQKRAQQILLKEQDRLTKEKEKLAKTNDHLQGRVKNLEEEVGTISISNKKAPKIAKEINFGGAIVTKSNLPTSNPNHPPANGKTSGKKNRLGKY